MEMHAPPPFHHHPPAGGGGGVRPRARAGEQLQLMSSLVTGRRYLLLSVLATAIAVASTYQRLLQLSPADWQQLLLEQQNDTDVAAGADAATVPTTNVEGGAEAAFGAANAMTAGVFVTELMRSRVSAAVSDALCCFTVRVPWLLVRGSQRAMCFFFSSNGADRDALLLGGHVPCVLGGCTRMLWRDSTRRDPGNVHER